MDKGGSFLSSGVKHQVNIASVVCGENMHLKFKVMNFFFKDTYEVERNGVIYE